MNFASTFCSELCALVHIQPHRSYPRREHVLSLLPIYFCLQWNRSLALPTDMPASSTSSWDGVDVRTWEEISPTGGHCGGECELGMIDLEDSFEIALLRLFPSS